MSFSNTHHTGAHCFLALPCGNTIQDRTVESWLCFRMSSFGQTPRSGALATIQRRVLHSLAIPPTRSTLIIFLGQLLPRAFSAANDRVSACRSNSTIRRLTKCDPYSRDRQLLASREGSDALKCLPTRSPVYHREVVEKGTISFISSSSSRDHLIREGRSAL